MKYSIILVSSLIASAFARPQASATITTAPSATVAGLTPAQSCIATCQAGDVNCEAACQGAAHPNTSQVIETTQCAEKCDQGDGTPAATAKYSQCVQACISSYFPTSQTVVAAAAGSQSAAASSASEASAQSATSTKATGSATGTATGTATGAAASSSKGAANVNAQMGASAVGFAGFFMALFAL